jgi:CelD/BcsL family acetyltransferase involved in cellulose biosynthesis
LSQLTLQEFTSWPALMPFRQQWNELVASQNLGPAHEFEWQATTWDVNQKNRELFVLLLRDGHGLAGIAPFVKEIEKRKGLSVRILRPLNWFHSLHGTQMVIARDPRTLLTAVFDHLTLNHGEWALWFTQYQRGEEQETMFTQALLERGYSFDSYPGVRSPYLKLEGTWEDKLKTLQPRFRTALRSREKRLREKGNVELRFLDSPNDWRSGLEAVSEIEENSWKVSAGSAITDQDFQWRFYTQYAPLAAERGTLKIPVLFLDGEPIAYDYALYDRGVYYLLKTSYKKNWSEMHPGFVLRKLLVEWVYTQRGSEIDFLGKDEDYKLKWTSTVREHTVNYAFNRNWSARYLRGIHRLGTLLRPKG